MRKLFLIFGLLLATIHLPLTTAFGQTITAVAINPDGSTAAITFANFTVGGTWANGFGTNGNPSTAKGVLTVTRPVPYTSSAANTAVHITWPVRYAYPAVWAGTTSYAGNNAVSDGTYVQVVVACSGTCTSAGSAPSWNATLFGTTVDNAGANQITWKNYGKLPTDALAPNTCYNANIYTSGQMTLQVALDFPVYASDTAVAATIASGLYTDTVHGASSAASGLTVTNNSTLAYRKPAFRWRTVGFQRVTGPFKLSMMGTHFWAQNGNQVQAVKYTCTDAHSNSNSATSTQMLVNNMYAGPVAGVADYSVMMPVTGFTALDQLTCQALVYPFFGDSNAVLNTSTSADGFTQPSESLGPIYMIYDPSNAYNPAYVAVKATGSDSTCTGRVFTTRAAAEADSGLLTQSKALSCLNSSANPTYTTNGAGGGMILMGAGSTWSTLGPRSALGTMKTWVIVTPITGVSPSSVIFTTGNGATPIDSDGNTLIEYYQVTFNGSANWFGYGNSTGTDSIWLNQCLGTASSAEAWYHYPGAMYVTGNTFTALNGSAFDINGTSRSPWALVDSNSVPNMSEAVVYALFGNNGIVPYKFLETGNANGMATSDTAVALFNTSYAITGITFAWDTATVTTRIGMAQNLFEVLSNSAYSLAAQNATAVNPVDGWSISHNAFVGSGGSYGYGRVNAGYNAAGTLFGSRYNWRIAFNNITFLTSKIDDYAGFTGFNGNRTGNWPIAWGTSVIGNISQVNPVFPNEFAGTGIVSPGNPQYLNDASTGAGGGNYHIQSNSASINTTPWLTVAADGFSYDLDGCARRGRIVAGPYTYAGCARPRR